MARVVPSKALTLHSHGMRFGRQPTTILDEGTYHNLVHTGKIRDVDKDWQSIAPPKVLPKLKPGTIVTICREMGLGDVLMVLVVIRALKKKYPHLRFRYATGRNYVKLIEGLGFLDSVVALMDADGTHPNTIELRGLSERHPKRMVLDRIDIFALYCGVTPTDYTLPLPETTDAERIRARDRLGSGCTIAVAVRGSTHLRSWKLEHVTDFALMAANAGWTVALLDGQRFDMPVHPRIKNLTGELSLFDVKGVLAESEFCVSPDTGVLHLAEAVGTKCLGIFTVIPPELRITHYQHVKAYARKDLACFGCMHRGCAAMPCSVGINPQMVLEGIESWDELPQISNPFVKRHSDLRIPQTAQ